MIKLTEQEYKQLAFLTNRFGIPLVNIHKLAREVAAMLTPRLTLPELFEMFKKLNRLEEAPQVAQAVVERYPDYKMRHIRLPKKLDEPSKTAKKKAPSKESCDPYFAKLADALGRRTTIPEAQQFFEDAMTVIAIAKRCGRDRILRAARYCRYAQGTVTMDVLELELRCVHYGYKHDPDAMRVISVPMGGKNSR